MYNLLILNTEYLQYSTVYSTVQGVDIVCARYTLYSHKECVHTTISEVLYSRRRSFSLYFIFRVRTAIDDIIILLHYKNEELIYMLKIGIILNDSNLLLN